jgi:Tfp pilus assembly protein PilO
MAKNSKSKAPVAAKRANKAQIVRIVLGLLVVLNLVAAGLVLYPPGGSAEALEQSLAQLQVQLKQSKTHLEETRQHALAVEKGRGAEEEFLKKYFVPRRSAPTALLTELTQIAQRAGIKDRGNAFSADLIDGSDSLGMLTITVNFEGTYANLLNFVREIDRSSSLLIIESLNAAPQQGSNILTVAIKMEAFIKEDGSGPIPAQLEAQR